MPPLITNTLHGVSFSPDEHCGTSWSVYLYAYIFTGHYEL